MLKNKYAVAIIASMAILMAILDNTIVNVALTPMANKFGASLNTIQWVITAFFLAQAAVIPIAGYLGNRFGIKRFFLLFLTLFTLGSLLCALAVDESQLIIFRIIQGLGGGALFPLGQAIAVNAFPVKERAKAGIIIGMSVLLGPIFGPTLGGFLVDNYGWESIFTINLPIGILTFILATISFQPDEKSKYPAAKFDYTGLFLSMIASLLIVYAFAMVTDVRPGTITAQNPRGEIYGWNYWMVWALMGTGILTGIFFCRYELRQKDPVLDLTIFKYSNFRSPVIILWIVTMIVFGSIFLIPVFFEQIRNPHLTAMQTGLALMPQGIAAAFATIIGGRLYYKLGVRTIVIIGMLFLIASGFMLTKFTSDYNYLDIMPALIVRGFGFGLTFIPTQTLALQSFTGPSLPKASSLLNVTRQIFGSIGVSVIATLFTGRLTNYMLEFRANMPQQNFDPQNAQVKSFMAQVLADNGANALNDVFTFLFYISFILLAIAFILPGKKQTQMFLQDHTQDGVVSE